MSRMKRVAEIIEERRKHTHNKKDIITAISRELDIYPDVAEKLYQQYCDAQTDVGC